ncbi:hypothetical protein [Halorussus halophilus]|uniref:hypothetical protein n=1 Tax=Halorussus halophilus TaxID=2650975 RepID=UPI001300F252|nr:hypothetical protein [Halorussus halophilus]
MLDGMADAIWAVLTERFDEDVRIVTYYDGDIYEIRIRDDLQERHSTTNNRAIVRNVMEEKLDVIEQEAIFDAGEFGCNVRVFEDAYVLHSQFDDRSGAIISMEREANLPTISAIEEAVEQVQPRE